MVVTIRTDSMAAVGAWSKERSGPPAINQIVREMALDLAEGLYDFDFVEHVAGIVNVLARNPGLVGNEHHAIGDVANYLARGVVNVVAVNVTET